LLSRAIGCKVRSVQRLNGVGPPVLSDELRYKILRLLEQQPHLSQRALARELGLSLGKANYCVHALIEKGLVKARNFRNSENKTAYMYYLTPKGIEDKARVTVRFLKSRMAEYELLKAEIEVLRRDAERVRGRHR
jgi:EPS-associated MarR family transcriptional regulator